LFSSTAFCPAPETKLLNGFELPGPLVIIFERRSKWFSISVNVTPLATHLHNDKKITSAASHAISSLSVASHNSAASSLIFA